MVWSQKKSNTTKQKICRLEKRKHKRQNGKGSHKHFNNSRNELDVELAKSTSKTPKTNNIILLLKLDFTMFSGFKINPPYNLIYYITQKNLIIEH